MAFLLDCVDDCGGSSVTYFDVRNVEVAGESLSFKTEDGRILLPTPLTFTHKYEPDIFHSWRGEKKHWLIYGNLKAL